MCVIIICKRVVLLLLAFCMNNFLSGCSLANVLEKERFLVDDDGGGAGKNCGYEMITMRMMMIKNILERRHLRNMKVGCGVKGKGD